MKAKVKVAIVIPSWNSAKDLPKLLESLKNQKLETAHLTVILVDNASSDNSINIAEKAYPGIVVVQSDQNLGLAGGNNLGIKKAMDLNQDSVIALNADTIADSSLVENLVKASQRHPGSLLSPMIYFASGREFHQERYKTAERGKVIWYAGGLIDNDNVIASNRGIDQVDKGQFHKESQTDFATGCCLFIPLSIAKKTGGFDPKLYLYYEDTDLSLRAKKIGSQIWFIPSAKLWHVNAGSSAVGSGLHDYFIARNRLTFGLRWAPFRAKAALIRQSLKILLTGRPWEKRGVTDFYLRRFGRGSFDS